MDTNTIPALMKAGEETSLFRSQAGKIPFLAIILILKSIVTILIL